jgi:hypothetical protein
VENDILASQPSLQCNGHKFAYPTKDGLLSRRKHSQFPPKKRVATLETRSK